MLIVKHVVSGERSMYAGTDKPLRKHYNNMNILNVLHPVNEAECLPIHTITYFYRV